MGFVEGEGCFSITIQKYIDRRQRKSKKKNKWKKPSLGFKVTPNFRVTAVADEVGVLYAIRERLGVGEIYIQERKNTPNARPACHYYVQTMVEIEKVIDFFTGREFYTSKGQSFQLWLKCIEIIKSGEHLTKEGLLEICELRDKMNFRILKSSRKSDQIKKLLELNLGHIENHSNQQRILHNNPESVLSDWYEKRQGNHRKKIIGSQASKNP